MMLRRIKESFKRLQKGRMRWVVAAVGTIQQSLKSSSLVHIYTDKDGDWYNSRKDASFVSPELNVTSWQQARTNVLDFWCHGYQPQLGDTVVDIGAGIGDDALVFSRLVGASGRVIAIEAHPQTYRCMVKAIEANGLTNVIAVHAAVSDAEGFISISDGDNFLSNSTQNGQGSIRVRTRTLENILEETGSARVDLIKMNIEGAETAALMGMTHVLSTTPHVVISCHDFKANRGEGEAFRTYDDVYKILTTSNYQLSNRQNDPRQEVPYYLYGKK
jgi:FkbM family methyltransferase